MAGALRWGYKAEAERTSEQVRRELGLTPHERLDYFALAKHLQVPIHPLRAMVARGLSAEALACLLDPDTGYSAVTVWRETRCVIVYNDDHSSQRIASDVTHELSHILEKHPPRPAIGFGGCRDWDGRYEEEAVWLSGALLVPQNGVLAYLCGSGTMTDGAIHFGVSSVLFWWRANVTGVVRMLNLVPMG
jgi:Zn-dependent peptidase ImmA (M78 family)